MLDMLDVFLISIVYYKEGGTVFSGGREIKNFNTVFQDFGKNMVRKRYFQL